VLHDLVHVEDLGPQHAATTQIQQLRRDVCSDLGSRVDLVDVLADLIGDPRRRAQELAIAEDRGQEVVEVVGHTPC
jgi:hypothetical protein